jgi:hypothetical protein
MEYRGPILLVFGLSLVMSPVAINLATTGRIFAEEQSDVASVEIDTGCHGQQMAFIDDSLCTQRTAVQTRDRSMPGGAMFVSARN